MLSLPGTPTLFYGEEIGMAENLDLPGRMAVRTPMQWQPGALGGFSTAPTPIGCADRSRPVDSAPTTSTSSGNAGPRFSAVLCAPTHSRLPGMPRAGWGAVTILDQQVRSVLAHRCDWSGSTVLLCHNLGSAAKTVRLTLADQPNGVRCAELFHAAEGVTVGEGGTVEVKLEAYAARWYRLVTDLDTALI